MQNVYINGVGAYLPGDPINNEEMDKYIGHIHGIPSRLKNMVLRQNGIKHRYYALNKNGVPYMENAQMAMKAAENALSKTQVSRGNIEYLASATTIGDTIVPGLASRVHQYLNIPPTEVASFQSVCASGVMAIKSAYLQIKADEKNNAIVTGSDFASRWFKPGFYEQCTVKEQAEKPDIETEFLRWTLSDGAGAMVLENRPNDQRRCFQVDWIDLKSFADRFKVCMYAGVTNNKSKGQLWGNFAHPYDAYKAGALMLKQDFKLLYDMFSVWAGYYLEVLDKHNLDPERIDYFLPHYSAQSLASEMKKTMQLTGGMIDESKWFNNLEHVGNTGTASIFIMLDALQNTYELKSGEQILCFVPESGQCIASFMKLTVI